MIPLALLRSLTQDAIIDDAGSYRLYKFVIVAAYLAGCLLNEGASRSPGRQAITPARYEEGALVTNLNAATGERGYPP